MSKIWNGLCEFLGNTWWVFLLISFAFFIGALLNLDHKQNQYCFDHQMVMVHTPAGHKCVKYEALVNINV